MNQFQEDLKTGKGYEGYILSRIQLNYPTSHMMEGKDSRYDIWIPEIEEGVEVKYDGMSAKTGNIVIEIEFGGVPSALSVTEAAWWTVITPTRVGWFLPERIRDCIKENNLVVREFVGRGDTKSKKAYLIKEQLLFNYAERTDKNERTH